MLLSLQTADSSVPTHQYILGRSCEDPTDKLSAALKTEVLSKLNDLRQVNAGAQAVSKHHPEETSFALFKNKQQNKLIA